MFTTRERDGKCTDEIGCVQKKRGKKSQFYRKNPREYVGREPGLT